MDLILGPPLTATLTENHDFLRRASKAKENVFFLGSFQLQAITVRASVVLQLTGLAGGKAS